MYIYIYTCNITHGCYRGCVYNVQVQNIYTYSETQGYVTIFHVVVVPGKSTGKACLRSLCGAQGYMYILGGFDGRRLNDMSGSWMGLAPCSLTYNICQADRFSGDKDKRQLETPSITLDFF